VTVGDQRYWPISIFPDEVVQRATNAAGSSDDQGIPGSAANEHCDQSGLLGRGPTHRACDGPAVPDNRQRIALQRLCLVVSGDASVLVEQSGIVSKLNANARRKDVDELLNTVVGLISPADLPPPRRWRSVTASLRIVALPTAFESRDAPLALASGRVYGDATTSK
jgi:hypothetical protein